MAGKDMAEKALESYNDVFADIVNTLLFNGREKVLEDELEQGRVFLPRRKIAEGTGAGHFKILEEE